jgi:ubiquitin C-terminal hydrolase
LNKFAENENNMLKEIVHDTFKIKLKRKFSCSLCKKDIKNSESSVFIVNLPDNNHLNVDSALNQYFNGLELDESTCYNCKIAKTRIKVQITRLPKIVTLRLKSSLDRFTNVKYDLKLCLSDFLDLERKGKYNSDYDLISVICYIGNSKSGHCMLKNYYKL